MRAGPSQPQAFLEALFDTAVDAANPHSTLAPHLPADTSGSARVIGAGKAAASMAAALERAWQGPLTGQVVTPYGHGEPCERIEVLEAAHPVPDDAGERTARRMLDSVVGLTAQDLVICLISGGGSALLALPAPGLTLADKRAINKALLRSGAAIDEMNCVRKHLSAIKGGRLAAAVAPARLMTFAISDVPGDAPSVIASGPTVPDPTTTTQAIGILERYNIDAGPAVMAHLRGEHAETIKPGDAAFERASFHMIGTPAQSINAAAQAASETGVDVIHLGAELEGDARTVGAEHAQLAMAEQVKARDSGRPRLVLSGGETTVTVRGNGRGGRNSEYALALALTLRGAPGIHALAADTDGIDGSETNAGAHVEPDTLARAAAQGLDVAAMLDNNDSFSLFEALGDLVNTGPTRTNVNDFRGILVLP